MVYNLTKYHLADDSRSLTSLVEADKQVSPVEELRNLPYACVHLHLSRQCWSCQLTSQISY